MVAAITGSSLFALGGGVLTILFLVQDRRERRQVATLRAQEPPPIMGGVRRRATLRRTSRPTPTSRRPASASARGDAAARPPALDRMAYRVIAFAFPIWTFAVIAGAIWAQQAWGRYWGWDPKETWSFITWVIYAGYLHARSTSGWKGRPAAVIALVGLRLAADHVLRGEPLDRRTALVQGVLTRVDRRPIGARRRWYSARGPAPAPASERLYRGGKGDLRKRLLWVLGLVAFGLMLASCAPHASQDTLKPAGPYAQEIKNLFVPVFWVAVVVFVIVEGGDRPHRRSGTATARAETGCRPRSTATPGWRSDGRSCRRVILAFVMVPTVATIWDLARKPPADALHVTVQGHQWWWGFVYTDDDMKTDVRRRGTDHGRRRHGDPRGPGRSPSTWSRSVD